MTLGENIMNEIWNTRKTLLMKYGTQEKCPLPCINSQTRLKLNILLISHLLFASTKEISISYGAPLPHAFDGHGEHSDRAEI
jgi:hypothetical protein